MSEFDTNLKIVLKIKKKSSPCLNMYVYYTNLQRLKRFCYKKINLFKIVNVTYGFFLAYSPLIKRYMYLLQRLSSLSWV